MRAYHQRYSLHPLAAIVDEVLGAVLAPERRRDVLAHALGAAGLGELPRRAAPARAFVEGALFSSLARHLDVNDALELVRQIRSSMELALSRMPEERTASDVRARDTLPAPPTRVVVVTPASLVVFLLQDMIGDAAELVPVDTMPALLDRLRRLRGHAALVVVDRKHPCIDETACALLREELDHRSVVVWWGAPSSEQRRVSALLLGGPRVISCEFDLRLADLGDLCCRLLEIPS